MKIARLLVTMKCEKHCEDCCNIWIGTHYKSTYIKDLRALQSYDVVCVTGGEPLLDIPRTQRIIRDLYDRPKRFVYLYTAKYVPIMDRVVAMVSGVHYTLHHPLLVDDLDGFYEFQKLAGRMHRFASYSFRLYIDQRIKTSITITPSVWSRVEVKPWEIKPPLPKDETMFRLDEDY